MAHSLSAQKRIRQNAAARATNRWRKVKFRSAIREYHETILHGTVEKATEQLQGIYKLLDQVAAKRTIHKNTAARYKSRLTLRLNKKRTDKSAA